MEGNTVAGPVVVVGYLQRLWEGSMAAVVADQLADSRLAADRVAGLDGNNMLAAPGALAASSAAAAGWSDSSKLQSAADCDAGTRT